MNKVQNNSYSLAVDITRAASKQTYYTIRCLADRELVSDAYRAYAYFRWVDDCLDANQNTSSERIAFLNRQKSLLVACYRREAPVEVSPEEQMLVDLVNNDAGKNSGLSAYLHNMMAVMAFDVDRRGRMISQAELSNYSHLLATAVTEALLYFIGHNCPSPCGETRYLAVRGAHVIHMLRDMVEDSATGYFNIPGEYVQAQGISFKDRENLPYRKWVYGRVKLASTYFKQGRQYLRGVKNLRCRLAGYAYLARFEWMARLIEKDGYFLRPEYPERKSLRAGLWMFWRTVSSVFGQYIPAVNPDEPAVLPLKVEEHEI